MNRLGSHHLYNQQDHQFWQVFFPGNWINAGNNIMYVTTGGGYAVGTNEYGDLAKEQRFIADEPYTIHNIIFWVGALEGTSATADKQVSCHNGIDAQTSTEAGPLGAVSISLVFDEYYA